ncbi:MAG TPA: putative beta-lysine N-acetyltransferase [Desulfotomaculum sp.]|nr:MAG: GCN5-related N-acetyltransferase [Desulfotomaculum sp. 46_80]HAG11779.1 putative beta-lysine N-acetyltransferase [Desulfotomaculum sp.]HBY03818.1 putative beta-lysine N-acetyltransferase [Desulfotomaculum sp.]
MSFEIRDIENIDPDRCEIVTGTDFKCNILISPYNRRITINNFKLLRDENAGNMIHELIEKASASGLDKIWTKSDARWKQALLNAGMKLEASIQGYFKGNRTAFIFALYLSRRRQVPSNNRSRELVDKLLSSSKPGMVKRKLPPGVSLKWGQAQHCQALARLYRRVFTTYPFPVYDHCYIKSILNNGRAYYLTAWYQEELIAASSAEVNYIQRNAEMTDFATMPEWTGQGLAGILLSQMESRLNKEGFRCLYTIARSSSIGMNSVFAKAGYRYDGVLINNCNIGEDFEDMNVWSKVI